MKYLAQILSFSALLTLIGCSNQWREVDVEFDDAELNEIFALSTQESTDSVKTQIQNMKDDPATAIYFATAPGALGPVVSVASLYSFAWLGSAEANLGYWDIEEVSVFVLDRIVGNGREVGLVFRYKTYSSSTHVTRMFMGSGQLDDKKYRAVFTDNGMPVLAVESFDIEGGDLAPVIKLNAYDYDFHGNEMDNGQFSTLVGFGG